MAYDNLPGIFSTRNDGNLVVSTKNENPIVCILGTAAKGTNDPYTVESTADAIQEFGKLDGTLTRGMLESYQGGALAMLLYRIGATPAVLATVGTGITITTIKKDDSAGTDYKLFWDDTLKRLRVWRASDDFLVYDNNPVYPSGAIDENEVSVTGTASLTPGDIGTLLAPVTLAAAHGVAGAAYTAGSDGIELSRMALYEALYVAYDLLENEDMDYVVPRNAYLDDLNTQDMTAAQVAAINTAAAPWAAGSAYPTPGTAWDVLGKLFVQEYNGQWYFWWDLDRDGIAEIFPTVGASTSTTDADGNALTLGDFREVSFAYQLADFCWTKSTNDTEVLGFIGTKGPTSWAPKDVSTWIGEAPVYAEDANGNLYVTTNGTGLLGNKYVAGRKDDAGTSLPGFPIDGTMGLAYGGFIGTDDHWVDGTQQKDENDHLIDIGKYISIVPAVGIFANSSATRSYAATCASFYAGYVSTLPANEAPTNQVVTGIRVPFRISNSKLDDLAGYRYVMLNQKTKGVVVADAPTAARPDSDYRRLMTCRIVKKVVDDIRAKADPFIGKGALTGVKLAGLDTAVDGSLAQNTKDGYLTRYEKLLTSTIQQRILGQATLRLTLVTVFELRQLTVVVSLAAQ